MIEMMKIINTHGVKGEMKAVHYADSLAFFKKVEYLYDKKENKFHITNVREGKNCVLVTIEGIEDMNSAERMKNVYLYAKREDFPPLPKGEYYLIDLIGLTAETVDGEEIGEVVDIQEKAAQNLIAIKNGDKEILIPKCDAFVDRVDLDEKKIYITPIEGLI
ncbi:MAG: 16S rRNA processing protein RimM [Clostridia bacterium]|nr:16S rRNA processing protein RimM [Clostridia bacterium]MBQ8758392.1 16S rRNA processing protein RimM [Clostridia bacterium]